MAADASLSDLAEKLQRCSLFSTLAGEDVKALRAIIRQKSFERGETLFNQGEECRGFYLVLSGRVEIYKLSPDGRKKVLFHAGPGQTFAEAALFGGQGYPAYAEAMEPAHAVFVPKDPFLELLSRHPRLAQSVMESLCIWLRRLTATVEQMAFFGARARLAQFLLQAASKGPRPTVLLTEKKKEVAARLGITPETLSRLLRHLEEEHLILNEGREVILRDTAALERITLEAPPSV